ncbi:MAG: RAD55 family ATPase [Halobacteria archaeon]
MEEGERVPVGIEGFDEMSNGGFPGNSVNIVTGKAGAGKTTFSTHYALAGGEDETALYINVDGLRDAVLRNARQYDMGIEEAVEAGDLYLEDYETVLAERGEEITGFRDLKRVVSHMIEELGITRLVVDSVAGLSFVGDSRTQIRGSIINFIRKIRSHDVTAVLVSECHGESKTRYGVEEYIGDSLVVLSIEEVDNGLKRYVSIPKMRYTDHDTSFRPLEISNEGMVVHEEQVVF